MPRQLPQVQHAQETKLELIQFNKHLIESLVRAILSKKDNLIAQVGNYLSMYKHIQEAGSQIALNQPVESEVFKIFVSNNCLDFEATGKKVKSRWTG